MKCGILFSGISKCCLLKCLPSMLNVNAKRCNDKLVLHSNSGSQDQRASAQSHLDLL